jgi:hypothetical protein
MTYSLHGADPVLHTVKLVDLRPTQMTVGLREVERKRRHFRELSAGEQAAFLAGHMVPTVLGPNNRRYVIDHHHLCRALIEEGCEGIFAITLADLSNTGKSMFWTVLDHHGWAHPYDRRGQRCDLTEMPRKIAKMADDPFRSLAGAVREAGGFAKDLTPFHEFLWAHFLRGQIKAEALEKDFDASVAEAVTVARSNAAKYLPGWCGPH